jgi:LysR family glycine cleavage system transcriptional activator
MRRLPPLRALRAFEAAARHESITKAAAELNVSHSAISQQVKALEHYFGQKMFVKSGNGLALKPKARAFLQDIRQGFDIVALAAENFLSSSVQNRVRVNATPSFALRWLIPRVTEFQKTFPKIEVRVETSTTDEIGRLSGNNDLVIRRYPMKRGGMSCEKILADDAIAVMSPRLAETQCVEGAEDLLGCELLHIKSRISAWPNWFRKAKILANETLKGQVFDHFFLSLEAAINGGGVALAPEALVAQDLSRGNLIHVVPETRLVGSGFYGLYNEADRSVHSVRKLIDWLTLEDTRQTEVDVDIQWHSDPA